MSGHPAWVAQAPQMPAAGGTLCIGDQFSLWEVSSSLKQQLSRRSFKL